MFEAIICSNRHGEDLVGQRVGLKQLTGIDEYRWQKLEERSPALLQIEHPNLSRHLGVFTGPRPWREGKERDDDDPQRFTVHLWVEGRPLAESVDTDPATVLGWLRQIAEGLDHLHGHAAGPFAHRDLHPRNVIINDKGDAVVIDFDTVFAGEGWTTTRPLLGSRFAALSATSIPPAASDRSALAKIGLHAFATDGDGALDDGKVLEVATSRLRSHGLRPERAIELLTEATAGAGETTCAALLSEVEEAARDHRRGGIRRVFPSRAGRPVQRPRRRKGWGALLSGRGAVVPVVLGLALLLGIGANALNSGDDPGPGPPPPVVTSVVSTTVPTTAAGEPVAPTTPVSPTVTAGPRPTGAPTTTLRPTTTVGPTPTIAVDQGRTAVTVAAPTTATSWQGPHNPDDRYHCGSYRQVRATQGVFSVQACLVVYRDGSGVYWYQGLLAASYNADVASGKDSLAGKIWSVADGATDVGGLCPSVSWGESARRWCFSDTKPYTGPGTLSARGEVIDSRGATIAVESPSFSAL